MTGHIAAIYGLRPQPFYLGIAFVATGLVLSALLVRETRGHARHEAAHHGAAEAVSPREVFLRTSFTDRELSSVSQAGLVNNLNDGMAWGLFPLFFAASKTLPAIATGAMAAAIVVEALLLVALVATPFDRRNTFAPYAHRRLSVVL